MPESRIVEVRIYRLPKGRRPEFHRHVHEEAIPMVKRWGHEVVAYGPSLVDPDTYFLIRAYDTVDQMKADQDAFYSSDEWQQGPRSAIVALIEHQSDVVFELTQEAISTLTKGFRISPLS